MATNPAESSNIKAHRSYHWAASFYFVVGQTKTYDFLAQISVLNVLFDISSHQSSIIVI